MPGIDGYVVVTREGKLKRPARSAPSIFLNHKVAINKARGEGDAVVPVHVDLDSPPIFIRERRL